ncbi:MAG: bifunctional nuclease family protein [Gemmatimonadaceae bacterium]
MVEVVVARLGIDSASQSYVLILQEKGGERLLPIWIGQPEAESIVMQMQNIRRARPLTHDLCKTLIASLGGTLRHVHITRVEKNTYYAEMQIHRGETVVQVDARPSDSIAIALRLSAPILVQDHLLTSPSDDPPADGEGQGGGDDRGPGARPSDDLSAEQLKAYLENLRPEDFGKFNL